MLHTKIVDAKKEKILTSNAEKFIKDSKFGASIYFLGTVRNINDNKTVTGITYDSHDEMVLKRCSTWEDKFCSITWLTRCKSSVTRDLISAST